LDRDVIAHGKSRSHRRACEIQAEIAVLNGHIAVASSDALGKRQRHAGERRDSRLRRRDKFKAGLEGVALEEVEKSLVVVVLDVDGVEVKGNPGRADAETDKNRIAAHRSAFSLAGAICRVEMQVLTCAQDLVAGVEVKQDTVRPAAWIVGDPKCIERDIDARVLQRNVGLRLADPDDGLRSASPRW
jgi:hypothetical protein